MSFGVDQIRFYVPRYYLGMDKLAAARQVSFDKYKDGLGQEKMAILPPNEDIVTMGASAAKDIVAGEDKTKIDMLIFATESSVDQSKAAGIHVHGLLQLSPRCRVVEMKQACYSGTAALRLALSYVRENPDSKVLIIASDVARYGLGTAGEATQGCGAVAMLVSKNPRVIAFDNKTGFLTKDVMDFWRPNYMAEAIVDGHYSTKLYLTTLLETWDIYKDVSGRTIQDHDFFCYHLPFTKIAVKAHTKLLQHSGLNESGSIPELLQRQVEPGLGYNQIIGNCYTASLYVALASLLDGVKDNLQGKRVGFFSYGSGCVAEFFSGTIQDGYKAALFTQAHKDMLNLRENVSYEMYERFYSYAVPQDDGEHTLPQESQAPFVLSAIKKHKRIYRENVKDLAACA